MNLYCYLKKHKKYIIIAPIFKLIESIFELIIPSVMANIIDLGIQNRDIAHILKMGNFIVILSALGFVAAISCQYMAAKVSQGVGTDIRNDLYKKVNSIPFFQIDEIGTASLITRITSDVNNLQKAVAMAIRLGIRVPFIIFGSLVMSYLIDKRLSVIFLVAVPLITIILFFVTTKSSKLFAVSRYKLDKLSLLSKENLDGIRVIRAFSRQESETNRFDDASNEYLDKGISALKIFSLMPPCSYVIVNSAIMAIIWLGAIRINSADLMPGQITALINYITQILFALFLASSLMTTFTRAYASYKRIIDILNSETESEKQRINIGVSDKFSPKIEFKNVIFSYTKHGEKELQNINFKVMPEETLGIIGSTGSGKTTIANLLLGFYQAQQGEILLDGINIQQYSAKLLSEKIKIVPQSAVLFSGTVEENLRMGNNKISDDDINKAIYVSQSSDFVNSLPQGVKSHIERGGKNLSGGQKQRLTIARAIVANSEILILDDSMSALDVGTSSRLKSALSSLKGITKIIISQKFINIADADKILVLDNGNLVGIGTHDYLLRECKMYKEIYDSQTK